MSAGAELTDAVLSASTNPVRAASDLPRISGGKIQQQAQPGYSGTTARSPLEYSRATDEQETESTRFISDGRSVSYPEIQ